METADWLLFGLLLAVISAFLWMTWLYLLTYKMLVTANRDRDRLIRRIGVYHSLPLITPYEKLPGADLETPIPPAFRMRRPQPPPGYRGPLKGDF